MANTVGELNVEIGAKLDKLEKALHKMDNSIKGAGKQAEKSSSTSFAKVGAAIAGAFAVDRIADFARQIVQVRGEFEKFEAVLTNTLGSGSAAQLALSNIQDFAAQTPFSVQELTDSFVRLANQGFRPTMAQMRMLGDLAASTGKRFDQLAEAIIDAQVGEFERLKEFGVRAQAEGDKVIFTFKGVKTEVDRTSESIQAYLVGLGELEGVSGSMEAISETLAGKVSNLGDAYDRLLNTIGQSELWKGAIDQTNNLLTATTELIDYISQDAVSGWDKFAAAVGMATGNPAAMANIIATNAAIKAQEQELLRYRNAMEEYEKKVMSTTEATVQLTRSQEKLITLGKKDIPSILGGDEGAELRQPIDQQLLDTTEALSLMESQLALAAETGNLFGGTLQSAFEASLINGESFFETFAVGLKNMIAQLIAAAAASAILAAILSSIGLGGLGTFGAIFGGGDSGSGLGGGFGGFFKLLGTDLVASTGRTGGQQGRFN